MIVFKQYELNSEESTLICWLPADDRLKYGARLTLKGIPDIIWTITGRYDTALMGADLNFIRGWKVGGIL